MPSFTILDLVNDLSTFGQFKRSHSFGTGSRECNPYGRGIEQYTRKDLIAYGHESAFGKGPRPQLSPADGEKIKNAKGGAVALWSGGSPTRVKLFAAVRDADAYWKEKVTRG